MRFEGAVFRDQSCLVQGELLYVWADSATRTSQPIPPALRDMMEQFERGQAPTTCRVDRWQAQAEAAQQVRRAVFIEEQGIDPADEYDAADATCDHAVVYNRLQQPVATGRLLPSEQGVATIGRMATLRVLRGSGLGAQVLEALMAQARARGDKRVQLHAQCSAQGFYAGLGYEPLGQPYQEVGIPHITMQRAL
jgi:predicted GNAT family N-acyltransferase